MEEAARIINTLQAIKRNEGDVDARLRELVAHPAWQVVVDERQHGELWTVGETTYLAAMAERLGPGDQPHAYMQMSGRHLVRTLPEDVQGVGFEMGQPHGLGLTREEWPRLLAIASALDVEDRLESPAPLQTERLFAHEFLVLCNEGGPYSLFINGTYGLALFTTPDLWRAFLEREPRFAELLAIPMTLRQLGESLTGLVHFDALWVNPHHEPRVDPWPPGVVPLLASGLDPRPEARILHARSIAELHCFLDQECMGEDGRTHTLEYWNEDTLVAHYHGTMLGRRAKSYRFEPVAGGGDPLAFGDGPSELLCAGYLLETVSRRLSLLPTSAAEVEGEDVAFVAETTRLAREMLKLMAHHKEFPRPTLRTVRGAAFVRKHWELANPSWIRGALERLDALNAKG
jgi:hypothetical protein